MARLLTSLATSRQFQLLVSTHSRHLLDEFSNLGAKIHWFSGGTVHADNSDRVAILLGLGALDAADRLRNGATPFIVLTEDSDTAYLRHVLSSSQLTSNRCEIWSYAGCTNEPAARVLAQFIREHAPATVILIHRDRDYLDQNDVDGYAERMRHLGLHPIVTAGSDIESHFSDVGHLAFVAQPLTEVRIAQLIDTATVDTQAESIERLTNSRVNAALRRRNKEGGGEPNYGQIAAAADADYRANPVRYRFGKKVLGRTVALLQQELGHNIQIAVDSDHLAIPDLRALV